MGTYSPLSQGTGFGEMALMHAFLVYTKLSISETETQMIGRDTSAA